jgi:hypothetical protein
LAFQNEGVPITAAVRIGVKNRVLRNEEKLRKEFIMKKKLFFAGICSSLLVFGIVLMGCAEFAEAMVAANELHTFYFD